LETGIPLLGTNGAGLTWASERSGNSSKSWLKLSLAPVAISTAETKARFSAIF
jgi:hypothetical protein